MANLAKALKEYTDAGHDVSKMLADVLGQKTALEKRIFDCESVEKDLQSKTHDLQDASSSITATLGRHDSHLQEADSRLVKAEADISQRVSFNSAYFFKSTATPPQGFAVADFNPGQFGAMKVKPIPSDEHTATTWIITTTTTP